VICNAFLHLFSIWRSRVPSPSKTGRSAILSSSLLPAAWPERNYPSDWPKRAKRPCYRERGVGSHSTSR
jgi:hypothetical protein